MSEQVGSYIKGILMLIVIFVVVGLLLTVLRNFIDKSEIIAFIAAAIFIFLGIIYSIHSGNRTAREDELLQSLSDTTASIFTLVDEAQGSPSLQKDKGEDQPSEQIREELSKVSNMLSQVRKANRFKRLEKSEEISNKIASTVKKIDSVGSTEDADKFYHAFQGQGNIILDVYRIIKDLEHQDNWLRAR